MKLPTKIRESFRRHGRTGGQARAAGMTPEVRKSIARKAATARWVSKRFGSASFEALGWPGGELVDKGLAALAEGKITVESLVVSIAAPRLRREGVPIAFVHQDPEEQLFNLLSSSSGDLAHSRYGAHLRQVSSFADACRRARLERTDHAP
ncbi:MAG: hypothetical protein U0V87_06735 [Acidobacteriota bacterium]